MSQPTLTLIRNSMILKGVQEDPPKDTGMLVGSNRRMSAPICEDILERLLSWRSDIQVDKRITEWLGRFRKRQDRLLNLARQENYEGSERLFPYQRVGSAWLYYSNRGIIADEQGMGKTVQACDALRKATSDQQAERFVVVCHDVKKQDWVDHVMEWAGRECIKLEGTAEERDLILSDWRRNDWGLVCNYTISKMHADDLGLGKPNVWIFDEVHKIRNRKSEWAEVIRRMTRSARWVWLVSASPQVNMTADLWIQLHLADPDRFRSYWSFVFRFCNVSDDGYGLKVGSLKQSEEEALERILDDYILRRKKVSDIPRIRRIVRYELPEEQRELYRGLEVEPYVVPWDGDVQFVDLPLARVTRKRQLALHPGLWLDGYEGPSKLDVLPGIIRERDSQAVVFTNYAEFVDLAVSRLIGEGITAVPLHGGLTRRAQADNLRSFASGEAQVIVATHGTGGEGLNLVQADRVIFMELAWHPAGNKHAQERIDRPGQIARQIEIIVVHAPGTVEDDIWDIIANKERVTVRKLADRERRRSQAT